MCRLNYTDRSIDYTVCKGSLLINGVRYSIHDYVINTLDKN